MDTGLLSLKWNNHSSTFFHVLETIRRKELYSDVTIACDGKFFSVHKLVLSTCSEYFQEMFERTQCKHPIIVLKDINYQDLESLLNYMYIGEVNVIQTELSSLIKAAECLKVKGLAVPDEPPPTNRKANKRSSDRDEGSYTKRNRRSTPVASAPIQVQSTSLEDRISSDLTTSPNASQEEEMSESLDKNKRLRQDEQSASHSFKEMESIIKVEKEDPPPEPYVQEVQDNLPPVTKYEYDGSPADNAIGSGLEESNESTYTSHLQQPPPSEDSMGHLIPSTSRYGESSWPGDMEGLEEGDKEGGEGGSYDPNAFLLENPQAKSQMARPLFNDLTLAQPSAPSGDIGFRGFGESSMEKSDGSREFAFEDGTSSVLAEVLAPRDPRTNKFNCSICSKTFSKKYNFRVHMRAHAGVKPYVCHYCGYKSCVSSNLYKHIRIKHTNELEQLDNV